MLQKDHVCMMDWAGNLYILEEHTCTCMIVNGIAFNEIQWHLNQALV